MCSHHMFLITSLDPRLKCPYHEVSQRAWNKPALPASHFHLYVHTVPILPTMQHSLNVNQDGGPGFWLSEAILSALLVSPQEIQAHILQPGHAHWPTAHQEAPTGPFGSFHSSKVSRRAPHLAVFSAIFV